MPYGIPKEAGGDSIRNVSKMESCVEQVKAKGHDESSAIAICKAKLFPSGLREKAKGARS